MINLITKFTLFSCLLITLCLANIRLPATSYPLNYNLKLDINVDDSIYSGSVAIRVKVTGENVNSLSLNYHEVGVSEVQIYSASDTTKVNLHNQTNAQPTNQIIVFTTTDPLVLNAEYIIALNFNGAIRTDLKGLYRSSYWINGLRRNMATTFFAPHYARMVFPCYDEPSYKATFNVQITNAIKYHALANAAPASNSQTSDTRTTVFEQTPKMSTYLLAFIVTDLVPTRDTNNGIAVWSQESRQNTTQFSLGYVHQVRRTLEDYLGLSYQLNKLDLVAVDDFLMGAMENWGLITFASGRLLNEAGRSTTTELMNIVKVVAHEVTHQWFGNLVTCQWWNDIWLNEGFATYLEEVITDKVANQWLVRDQFVVNEKIPAMRKDSDRSNEKAMSGEVTTLEEISAIYDFVAYSKAASVIRMFHYVVSEAVFQETLREYMKTFQYANVERKQLFAVLEQVARRMNFNNPQGISLADAFENWAQNYGFPLVTVQRDANRGVLKISQSRFIQTGLPFQTPRVNFFVPLLFASEKNQSMDETMPMEWLTPNQPDINMQFSGDWVLVNPNAFGYYRVNYETENWNKLSNLLHTTNHIPSLSRVQLIDDVMTLARFNHVPYAIALNLIRYIKSETSFSPIRSALEHLSDFERSTRGFEINTRAFLYDILDSLYKLNKLTTDLDRLVTAEVRNSACQFGYPECLTDSKKLFEEFTRTGQVDADFRRMMFCGAVNAREGGNYSQVFNIWSQLAKSEYDRSVNENVVGDILRGFRCIQNESEMQELLTYSLRVDVGIFMTTADRLRILSSVVSGSVEGTGLALNMLQNNWNVAISRYGSAASIYNALGAYVILPAHVTIFNEIVFTHMRKTEIKTYSAATDAVHQVEENVQFRMSHRDPLTEWFNENYPSSAIRRHSSRLYILLTGVLLFCLRYL